MSCFGEEYVEVIIRLDSDTHYMFDKNIDILEYCGENCISKFIDFSWRDVKKIITDNFDIKFITADDISYSYNVSRNLYGEFLIEVDGHVKGRYIRERFESLERRLKIKGVINED